jgi:hypothetical protein
MTPMRNAVSVVLYAQGETQSSPTVLENIKTISEIVGTVITAIAVLVGGIWAYSKFVRGRTFRPRLALESSGQWHRVDGLAILQVQISVKNIGASKVAVTQTGTGFRISQMNVEQPEPPALVQWAKVKTFAILENHAWIEPGETVIERPLVNLGVAQPLPLRIETRLVMKRSPPLSNIEVNDARYIPPRDPAEAQPDAAASNGEKARQGGKHE